MDFKLRTILVGLISLAVILAIYMLYSHVSETPQIDIEPAGQFAEAAAEGNVDDFDDEIGKISGVGIAAVKKPVFRHLKNGQVDREFGFEELLHEVRGEWEVEKPYINIYHPNFKCYVTADRGTVQVETAVGRPSPRDATFTGNVVIHLLPESGSDIKKSSIYLDDVAFVTEKSSLSTSGPVRFVSQDAQMLGEGMELIYNEQLDRLELFRIVNLGSLLLNARFSHPAARRASDIEHPASSVEHRASSIEKGEYYKCILSKNVIIDSPEQLVFARDHVLISNIFWSRASDEKSYPEQQGTGDEGQATNGQSPKRERRVRANEGRVAREDDFGDIVVTCDNGIVLVPVNSTREQNISDTISGGETVPDGNHPKSFDDMVGRQIFITSRIGYDISNGDAIVPGPSELTFYTSDATGAESQEASIPVKITAQKEAKFLSASNQVIFQGDCVCTMLRTEPNNVQQKHTLTAPKLTTNLESRATGQGSRVKHLTADGGVVKLQSRKKSKGQVLGGADLECRRLDYDTDQEMFEAIGPGMITLDNSKISEPNEQLSRFSFRRPCYAFLRDFAKLKYFQKVNRIIADAGPEGTLQVNYIPIVKGQYGQQVLATAAHAEVNFTQTADSQTELSSLIASGAITYDDGKKQFQGSKLLYDAGKSIVTVQGDESEPCFFNGAAVDGFVWDLKTDRIKFDIAGPSAL